MDIGVSTCADTPIADVLLSYKSNVAQYKKSGHGG